MSWFYKKDGESPEEFDKRMKRLQDGYKLPPIVRVSGIEPHWARGLTPYEARKRAEEVAKAEREGDVEHAYADRWVESHPDIVIKLNVYMLALMEHASKKTAQWGIIESAYWRAKYRSC
jgi:hypothetical protein